MVGDTISNIYRRALRASINDIIAVGMAKPYRAITNVSLIEEN